ncbi:hypothetical protein D3C72_1926480 [compost metagenome]
MPDIAHQGHGQIRQVLLGVQHGLYQCQGGQGVCVRTVTGIDDTQARRSVRGGTMSRAAGRMAQHQHAGLQARHRLGQRVAHMRGAGRRA